MRSITYAGQTVLTTDEVAETLVALTAALARNGQAEAVRIPIVFETSRRTGDAELVIGLGNDVLSVPVDWGDETPDFSEYVTTLRAHPALPQPQPDNVTDLPSPPEEIFDHDMYTDRA